MSAPRRINRHTAAGGVLFLVLAMALSTACGSTPDRVAYTSISAATDAVQTSLQVFNELYQTGVRTDPVTWNDRRTKAKDAYEKYQTVALAAVNLSQKVADPQHQASITEMVSTAAAEALRIIQAFGGGK